MNEKDWPIIGVFNLQNTLDYYSNCLLFEIPGNNLTAKSFNDVAVKLYDFFLILRHDTKGPIYDSRRYKEKIKPNILPTLLIPVPDVKAFYGVLKSRNAKIISENHFLGHDLEGFYVMDNDSNKILFFTDYHGPYDPSLWEWTWEDSGG